MCTLFLVRGLPGSGKTTLSIHLNGVAFSADDYFINDIGKYVFDPRFLADAHAFCQKNVEQAIADGIEKVIVNNTMSARWEMEPYLRLAEKWNVTLTVIDLFDGGLTDEQLFQRNVHQVPLETIKQMRRRWETNWKDGNPTPPWERKFRGGK